MEFQVDLGDVVEVLLRYGVEPGVEVGLAVEEEWALEEEFVRFDVHLATGAEELGPA